MTIAGTAILVFFIIPLLAFGVVSITITTYVSESTTEEERERAYLERTPNECWYEQEDGTMTPCEIESINPITKSVVSHLPHIGLVVAVILLIVIYKKNKKTIN